MVVLIIGSLGIVPALSLCLVTLFWNIIMYGSIYKTILARMCEFHLRHTYVLFTCS